MSLKNNARELILKEVLRSENKPAVLEGEEKENRILIWDQLTMQIISACFKRHEITDEFLLYEQIGKKRTPLRNFKAVYLLTPIAESIRGLINDFVNHKTKMYREAHVYFTEACPNDLFHELRPICRYIKTLKEINVSYIPIERQVFTVDSKDSFQYYYNPSYSQSRTEHMERIAEQIATLCVTLDEFPTVRYRSAFEPNRELAGIVENKLNQYKLDEPLLGEGGEAKKLSQLVIVDRGFDCVTPIIHELTFQAMVYDLLPIENNAFRYEKDEVKIMFLDENNELWVKSRHQHIFPVTRNLQQELNEAVQSNKIFKIGNEPMSLSDLSTVIKKMPQHQKEIYPHVVRIALAEECMKLLNDGLYDVCRTEQSLVSGLDEEGKKFNYVEKITPVLRNHKLSRTDKLRAIILLILSKNGAFSEENIDKLLLHANLGEKEKNMIVNLSYLGCNLFTNGDSDSNINTPRKKRISEEPEFATSRWIPVVKDVMEECISDGLSKTEYPFVPGRAVTTNNNYQAPLSTRLRRKNLQKEQVSQKNLPRIIVFIVGGMTYSEMRCAYEVTKDAKHWEMVVGSSHILTPKNFLESLNDLN